MTIFRSTLSVIRRKAQDMGHGVYKEIEAVIFFAARWLLSAASEHRPCALGLGPGFFT